MKRFFEAFIPLFVAIDVFALLPLFIAFTMGFSEEAKRKLTNLSVFTAFWVSAGFVAVGEAIFRIIGLTVDDFKISGGILLLVIAVLEVLKTEPRKVPSAEDITVGVVPIAVPMIVGPAVLTTLIILLEHHGVFITLLSLVLNLSLVWLLFRKANKIVRLFGRNGIMVISKLMAILLASIAVMMIRIGISNTFEMVK